MNSNYTSGKKQFVVRKQELSDVLNSIINVFGLEG
jgi:hypothetical protein